MQRLISSFIIFCSIYTAHGLAALSDRAHAQTKSISNSNSSDIVDIGRPATRVYTSKDGLPQNTVMALAFDKNSYLWVGTQDGGTFYNGRGWNVVNMPNKMISNYIRAILTARDGSIWFGRQEGGIARLKEQQWSTIDTNSGLPNNRVRCLMETEDSSGTAVWVGTDGGGLARYQNGQWTVFNTSSGLPSNSVRSLLMTRSDRGEIVIWAGTEESGLARFENNVWTVFNTGNGLPNNQVLSLAETRTKEGKSIVWVGTDGGGLARLEQGQWSVVNTANGLPGNRVWALCPTSAHDGETVLWAGTFDGGLARYYQGRWTTINTSRGLPNNQIVSLIASEGKNGAPAIWVGTYGGGLARIESSGWTAFDSRAGLPSNVVRNLLVTEDDNGEMILWVATANGLSRWQKGEWKNFDTRSGLPNNLIYYMLESQGEAGRRALWIGTDSGLARFQDGRWQVYTTASGMPHNQAIVLLETRSAQGKKVLWVGTNNGGLGRLEDEKWTRFDTGNGLPHNGVHALLETVAADGTPTLWAGTSGGGLARYERGVWKTYNIKDGLPNNQVISLRETVASNGKRYLWAGTNGGVARMELYAQNERWVTFSDTSNPRLPNNIIYQICEDAKKRIYLFTNKGVARLTPRLPTEEDPAEYSVYTFTTEDGLPSNQCSFRAATLDKRGRIWAGTVEGVAMFDPASEYLDQTLKQLRVEQALVSGTAKAINNATLPYDENHLLFEYALLCYFRESDTHFRTQLVGLEERPSDWTKDYKRNFTNLSEGKYLFKVWGRDYAGNISGPVEVAFTILPAPWRTWWAYLLYFGIVAGAGYGGVRLRLRALKRHNLELEEKVRLRTRELASKNEELAKKNEELVRSKEELEQSHKQAERIFTALSDVLPGTVLNERYRIDKKIGAGGFGVVYRATHLDLNRPVAVKVFRPSAGNASVDALERFRREGMSICKINHQNAVAVLDSGVSTEGIAYLVMELLQGYTLTELLRRETRLTPQRTAEIIIPICNVLAVAHRTGIIHRDIKPDNIFLHQSPEGEIVKVVDFGIAKLMGDTGSAMPESITATGGILGTPTYMSPERLTSKPYDGRADVYSVGVMLYQMLCGIVPFRSDDGSFISVVMKHLMEVPQPPGEIVPDVPPAVADIVMRTLTKDPEKRPTAEQLSQELANAVGIPIITRPSGGFKVFNDERAYEEMPSTLEETRKTSENEPQKTVSEPQPLTGEITRIIPKSD